MKARLILVILLCGFASGCSLFRRAERPPEGSPSEPTTDGALTVSLTFGRAADLDLYVTDPLLETVYFANTPSRSGGSLDRDRRCDDDHPRVETVRFEQPLPGLYRIGVDYPERCHAVKDPVPFLVRVDAEGFGREHRGATSLGRFEAVVMEFELERESDMEIAR